MPCRGRRGSPAGHPLPSSNPVGGEAPMRLPLTACRTALAGLFVAVLVGLAVAQDPQPPAQDAKPAYLRVTVPDPKAKLEIEGTATKSEGEVRTFVSPALPPLPAGKKYIYVVKATWTAGGQPVT